jgi:hypothetical protein
MSQPAVVHLLNEDPVVAELEKMPEPSDTLVVLASPRRKDGKPIQYLSEDVTTVIFPMHRISSIEILSEGGAAEEDITFYRA